MRRSEISLSSKLPLKISPCPIVEAILELRFDTSLPGEAIFGVVYTAFRHDYPKSERQPVLQIPEPIRQNDNNLKFLPEYRLSGKKFSLLVGSKSIGLSISGEYSGWSLFQEKIAHMLDKIHEMEIVDSVTRLGLRYINVFREDIFSNSTLKIMLGEEPLQMKSSQIQLQLPADNCEHTLRLAHGSVVKQGPKVVGESVVDIDTVRTNDLGALFDNRSEIIENLHQEEKKLFFSLLTDEYLSTLSPEF